MGLFDRQKLFRGEKLTEAYKEGENFVLYDLAVVVEDSKDLIEGSVVDKVELIVGDTDGSMPFMASTLSKPIANLAYQNTRDSKGIPVADDLPAIVCWKKVDTKNAFDNQATVIDMIAPYKGDRPKSLPEWSFPPITQEDNPL